MRLYVANCTKQNWQVQYRLDFNSQGQRDQNARFQPAKQQDIPPGRQIQLGGDMHITQIEDIVQQLSKFGLVGVVDVPRLKNMAPLVFNVDKPVPVDVMRRVQHNNSALLIEQGRLRRQRAAIAVNDLVQQKVANEFMAAGVEEAPTDKIDVAFEQVEQSEAGEKRIEEGYRVSAEGQRPSGAAKNKTSKKKRG